MAIRYAVANGNWSNTATWNGGTLPASGDDVYTNNFTVSIDQSITAKSLKKISNGSPAITAGGSFTVTAAATVTITDGIAAADNATNFTPLLTVNAGSAAVTLTANVVGGSTNTRAGVIADAAYSGTLTINGNLTGGGNTACNAVTINSVGATIVVTGNLVGGNGAHGIALSAVSTLTVTGNATGGTSVAGRGVYAAAGQVTLRGDLRPGTVAAGGAAVETLAAAVLRYSGNIYSGGMALNTGPNGWFPLVGGWSVIDGEEVSLHVYNDDNFPSGNNGTLTVLTQYGTDLPDQADVRDGVLYGPGDTLEGALAVPPASAVAAGTPVDDTVGTATLDRDDLIADILAGVGSQIAAAS